MRKLTDLKIISDTREQYPFEFKEYDNIRIYNDTLDFGDYTLVGHEFPHDDESIIIERKAHCKELLNNLGTNWNRFEREAEELQKYKHKCIIVCGPENFNMLYRQNLTQINPDFAYRQLSILHTKYQLPTLFFENRENAENYVYRMFKRIKELVNNYE